MKIKITQIILAFILITCITNSTISQELKKGIQYTQHKYIPFYNLRKISNTIIFQGNKKKKNYFEGWYFKLVSKDGASIFSVIPGISLSNDGKEQHAFIQIINGVTAQTSYYTFSIEEFSFSKKDFAIKIADNYFSLDSIIVNIKDNGSFVCGKIVMTDHVEYKSDKLINTGIMGPYRFVPFLECYHGVGSLTHALKGNLIVNNEVHDFNGGRGYIEKDWGSSMPSAWIWMQSNKFNDVNSSFMLAIADVPWLGKSYPGFLGFFYKNNKIHHFATYRNSKLELNILDSSQVMITIKNRKNIFIITARSNKSGVLKAPVKGAMDRIISESIDAKLKITMMNQTGKIISIDSTNIAGLEMVGDYRKLQRLLK